MLSMASASNDGRIAAKVVELFGNETLKGSSSRGGAKVLFLMVKGLKAGKTGAVTPDGPRGPLYQLQAGVISIAQKSGKPLVPFHTESTRQWIFEKSWDKHKLPKPFSTIVIGVGKPFYIPSKLEREEFDSYRKSFEMEMLNNAEKTEKAVSELRKSK